MLDLAAVVQGFILWGLNVSYILSAISLLLLFTGFSAPI